MEAPIAKQSITALNENALSPPGIRSVGTATPDSRYQQEQLLHLYADDRRAASIFLNGGIRSRHLVLPEVTDAGTLRPETQADLISKHMKNAREIGAQAIQACLDKGGFTASDVDYICCVTSTGFTSPGLSAHLIKDLQLRPDCQRLDVVGMGCNAGLNGLNAASAWATANPGRLAVLACIEICSALYVPDATVENIVVNSLFGDGAAAIALAVDLPSSEPLPRLLGFNSMIITSAINAMRIDWSESNGKFSFGLERDVPYVVGANAGRACDALLSRFGLNRSDVNHWIIHSGGKRVIDSLRVNLALSKYDVRHTLSVLRDHGNLSSGSFLFSLKRLGEEGAAAVGDLGLMMTMGPGSTIETALLRWQ